MQAQEAIALLGQFNPTAEVIVVGDTIFAVQHMQPEARAAIEAIASYEAERISKLLQGDEITAHVPCSSEQPSCKDYAVPDPTTGAANYVLAPFGPIPIGQARGKEQPGRCEGEAGKARKWCPACGAYHSV